MDKPVTTSSECIVQGCAQEARHRLDVTCRIVQNETPPFASTDEAATLSSPGAYLCDDHVPGGAKMTLLLEPGSSKETTIRVIAVERVEEGTASISTKAHAADGSALARYPHLRRQAEEIMLRETVMKLANAFGWTIFIIPDLPERSGNGG